MEHHPNFWNTTPSSRGDSGTIFWNTTPLAQQREHQPARVGVLVQLFGTPGSPTRPRATPYMVRVLVQPLEHHPYEPQGQSAILDHFSMAGGTQAKNADKSIDTPLRARPTDPQQCFSLLSLQTWGSGTKHLDPPHPAVIFTLFSVAWGPTPRQAQAYPSEGLWPCAPPSSAWGRSDVPVGTPFLRKTTRRSYRNVIE